MEPESCNLDVSGGSFDDDLEAQKPQISGQLTTIVTQGNSNVGVDANEIKLQIDKSGEEEQNVIQL